jgi:hypothetical protein
MKNRCKYSTMSIIAMPKTPVNHSKAIGHRKKADPTIGGGGFTGDGRIGGLVGVKST